MNIDIIEVTNSMSPQGIFIGSASEASSELPSSAGVGDSLYSNCELERTYTPSSSETIGLTLSPTSNVPLESLTDDDSEVSSLALDDHDDDAVEANYTKLDLTQYVIKGLTEPDKNALDILSAYDHERTGCLSISVMKKCLTLYSLFLSERDFHVVFEDFIENNQVKYVLFLKTWSDFIEPDWCCSQKRSCHYDGVDGIGYSAPKRRLIAPTPEDYDVLQKQIGCLFMRHFGNSQGIFNELAEKDVMYVSDFYKYLEQNQIMCTLNQVILLAQPFCSTYAVLTREEFQEFAKSLTCTTSKQLVEAFPSKFGRTIHISMNRNLLNGESELKRIPSVAQNLDQLSLYGFMVMNNDAQSSQEDDDDAVCI